MTRQELILRLLEKSPFFLADDSNLSVNLIFDYITKSLDEGKRVEIRGFGSFTLAERAERVARNPQTNEKVTVPAKKIPHFKPGKNLRELVATGYGNEIKD